MGTENKNKKKKINLSRSSFIDISSFFNNFLETYKKVSNTCSYYRSSTSSPSDKWKLKFYEWSDTTNEPLEFESFESFLVFANKCHIVLSMEDRIKIHHKGCSTTSCPHVMCTKDGIKVLVESSPYMLNYENKRYEESLERLAKEQATTASPTTTTTVNGITIQSNSGSSNPSTCNPPMLPMKQMYPARPYEHSLID